MNKQELLYGLNQVRDIYSNCDKFQSGARTGLATAITLVEQLDEPEKVVVPRFVAEWYEENKKDLEYAIYSISIDVSGNKTAEFTEIEAWFNNILNKSTETLIKMKLFGYEVQKEKLYYIKFSENQYAQRFNDSKMDSVLVTDKLIAGRFTEGQIKKMNPALMAFAVEVAE